MKCWNAIILWNWLIVTSVHRNEILQTEWCALVYWFHFVDDEAFNGSLELSSIFFLCLWKSMNEQMGQFFYGKTWTQQNSYLRVYRQDISIQYGHIFLHLHLLIAIQLVLFSLLFQKKTEWFEKQKFHSMSIFEWNWNRKGSET